MRAETAARATFVPLMAKKLLTLACAFWITARTVCAFDALLPDPTLTPGKVADPRLRTFLSSQMVDLVFARYGIPVERRDEYRIDHLIPKELGGADAIENLWPQKKDVRPYSPERKDLLTRRMLALIASHRITLQQAQQEMAQDWISAYVVRIGMIYLAPGRGEPTPR